MSPPAKRGADPLADYAHKRDFSRTAEPEPTLKATGATLHFVVQKHAATRLHYDFRLELDGVLRSWAVPKGPSDEPGVRRLAVQVEDHPLAYGNFEGTIPKGAYGGGTVMLWDKGTYTYAGSDADPTAGMRDGIRNGKIQFTLKGKRLRGTWTLVRTSRAPDGSEWLLMKQKSPGTPAARDATEKFDTSIKTARTMDEITRGGKK